MRSFFQKSGGGFEAWALLSLCMAFVFLPLFADADCDIPEGAELRTIEKANKKMLESPRNSSKPAMGFNLKVGHKLMVWGDPKNGFLKACFKGQNNDGYFQVPGYVRNDWFVQKEKPPARASGGRGTVTEQPEAPIDNTNGCIPPGLTEEPLIGKPIVQIQKLTRLKNFAGSNCPQLLPFAGSTKFYQLQGRKLDKDGNPLIEVAVYSNTRGAMVSGWVSENDVKVTYDGNTEAGYCAHGGCQNVNGNNGQGLRDVARFTQAIGPDQSGEGCKVLDRGNPWSHEQATALRACVDTLRERIWRGSNGNRWNIMCNLRTRLSPAEQELAAMVFASLGEGSIFITSDDTQPPRHKELSFIQKVIENRTREMKKIMGNQYTALDAAMAHEQFSVFRSDSFKGVIDFFNPRSTDVRTRGHNAAVIDKQLDGAVRALIDMKNGAVQPTPDADYVDMYYNPHGMTELKDMPRRTRKQRQRIRNHPSRYNRLKRQGYIDHTHPRHRITPPWNFSNLRTFNNINFRGVKKDHNPPFMHNFFITKNKRPYFGDRQRIREARQSAMDVISGKERTCTKDW